MVARPLEGINSGQPGLSSSASRAAGQPAGSGEAAGAQASQQLPAATQVQSNARRGRSTGRRQR
eukprot:3980976-Alexandrium_andersonii.AAC.1